MVQNLVSHHGSLITGIIGRPIRIPKETYAVPGTAVEIVAHCKYDVTEDQVEWSRVIVSKGKEKEGEV